jgi:hypothetical protein
VSLERLFQKIFHVFKSPVNGVTDHSLTDALGSGNGALAHSQIMSIDAFGLLVRQRSDGGMELFDRHFTLIDFAGGQGHEQNVVLDAIPTIQRVIRLVTVSPQIVGGFGVLPIKTEYER